MLSKLGPTFEHTELWQWGILLGAILGGLLVGKVIAAVLNRLATRMERKERTTRSTAFRNTANPLSLAFLTTGVLLGLRFIYLSDPAETFTWKLIQLLYLLALGWLLYNLVDIVEFGLRKLTAKTASPLDDMAVPLVRKTLRVFIVVVFILVLAQNVFGLDITGWLAGLGIAGLAVSLAAQDSLKNLFGSMVIFFDHPFSVGDWVIFDGCEGYVEEIGFRSTRIRLWSRYQVTIPNMKFNDRNVTNVTRRFLDRRVMDINITYDTPPAKVREAVQIIDEILHEPDVAAPFDLEKHPPHIAFNGFNAASLNIRVYYYFIIEQGRNYWDFFEHCHLFNLKLLERFNAAGIDFAFPTQTLHLAGDEKRELSMRLLQGGQSPTPPAQAS
jgi:MscS family membrane protein